MNSEFTPSSPPQENPAAFGRRGQALVEYVLILALLAIGFGFALAATGPAIGNVFSNVIHNVVGENPANAVNLAGVGGAPINFWQTVTWVAQNPQLETPFAGPVVAAPGGGGGPQAFLSPTPTISRTPTPSRTFTPSPTFTPTATGGPSPTPPDRAFAVPFVEQVNAQNDYTLIGASNAANWRIADTGPALTGSWEVEWFSTRGGTATDAAFTLSGGTGTRAPLSAQSNFVFDVNRPYNIDFNWGTGRPAGVTFANNDNWGAIFTGTFTIDRTTTLRFNTPAADEFIRIRRGANYAAALASAPFITDSATTAGTQPIQTFAPGTHVIVIEYGEGTSNASLNIQIERLHNTDDRLESINAAQCNVGRTADSQRAINAASASEMFAQSNDSNDRVTWNANRTCYLELRGYVDLSTGTNPQLSFWDLWDFTGTGGTNMAVDLEIADYVSDGSGGLNRGAVNWRTIPLRAGGTSNYQWTRTQIDLAQIAPALTSSRVTFRFRITNTSTTTNASNVRWLLDDIQITNRPNPAAVFTVGNQWNFNTREQLNDFIFDSDSSRTLEQAGFPVAPNAWRWNLTSDRARGGVCCALEESPSANPAYFDSLDGLPSNSVRVHYAELRHPIDLRSGIAPSADSSGNTGAPLLTFWQSFNINDNNIRLVVEYSRDDLTFAPGDAATPRTWIEIPRDGLLADYSSPATGTGTTAASASNPNRALNRTQNLMQPVQIALTQIPDWDTQPFRVRFALYLNGDPGNNAGWWLDDVVLERDNASVYAPFPFIDGAENASFTSQNWRTNIAWSATEERGGAFFSTSSYADSPGAVYQPNVTNFFEMRRTIDLLRDTPANSGSASEGPARPAAVQPMLSFYHQRQIANQTEFRVELWTPQTNIWVSVWRYSGDNSGDDIANITTTNRQDSWERVEINLTQALVHHLRTATGNNGWTWGGTGTRAVTGNGTDSLIDDDIRIRFVVAAQSSTDNGVWLDEIQIVEQPQIVHRVWGATPFSATVSGPGDGALVDDIERANPNLPSNWFDRFYRGSTWDGVDGVSGFTRSGGLALHDSPRTSGGSDVNYLADSFHMVEYIPIIDLRGLTAAQLPMLDFWTRFAIGSGDTWRIQIATENTTDTGEQRYNDMGGWNAWSNVNFTPDGSSSITSRGPGQVNTWLRTRLDLSGFVGQRIRVRWLLHAANDGTVSDGLYIDNFSVTWGRNVIATPFEDLAESMGNWVAEGTWGLAPDFFFGSGSTTPALGSFQWQGFVIDCTSATRSAAGPGTNCDANGYRRILDHYYGSPTPLLNWTTGTGYPAGVFRMPGLTDINYFLGVGRIPGTPNGNFDDTVTARWRRVVNLEPGTYQIQVIGDDGFRLRIDNTAGTTLATPNIIDSWTNGSGRLISASLTVTANITRTLELDFFESGGDATIALYITRSSFAFTNSPNVLQPDGTYNPPVVSPIYSYSSLTSNGVFDFSGNSSPVLTYRRLHQLAGNNSIRVQVSVNNGISWTDVPNGEQSDNNGASWSGSNNTATGNRMPPESWRLIRVNLVNINMGGTVRCCGGRNDVMIRFVFDNLNNGTNTATGDGAYITTIRLQ